MKPGINPFVATCLRSSLALALTFLGGQASAVPYTYTITPNTSPGSSWLAGAGWDTAPLSGTDTILTFTTPAALTAGDVNFSTNDTASVPFQLNRLNFTPIGPASGTAPVVTISGSSLEFISNGATTPILNFGATGVSAPTLTIQNNLILSNNISIQGASNGTLSGVISGGGNITKSGGGVVTLNNAANTYTGTLTIDAGTIAIANAGALAGSSITVGNSDSSAASLRISGGTTAGLGKSVTINGLGAGSTGALAGGSGTNVWEGGVVLGSLVNRIGVASGGTLFNISGVISGSNGLVVRTDSGTQVVKFSGSNTYTGQTRIAVGILEVSNIGNVGSGAGNLGNVSSAANGTIILGLGSSNSTVIAPTLRYVGTGETTDRVIRVESGSTATVNATINHNGTGTLRFNSDLVADGAAAKTLTLTSASAAIGEFAGVIGNGSGGGAVAVTKTGAGLWNLLGANTYSGTTTVSAGTLRVSTSTSLGNTTGGTISNGTGIVQLQSGLTITGESLDIVARSSVGGGIGFQALGTSEWTGAITATADAVNTGNSSRVSADAGATLTLSGNISAVVGTNTFGLGDASTSTGGTGLVFTGAGNINASGVISGAMSVITTSSGTIRIQNTANTYTGQTRLQGGVLEVSSLKNAGVASSLGAATGVSSAIAFNGNSTLRYIGSGDTTDRSIALYAGTNGATLDQSGTGKLTFAGNLVNPGSAGAANAKTLAFTGTGEGEYSGVLGNAAVGTSVNLTVTKSGTGTWTFSGTNTYSGNTTVSQGTLKIGGGGINNSTQISATGGGSLELIAGNVLGDAAAISLNNGTLVVNGNASEITGTLAVGASGGTLNMIGGLNELRFAQSSSATWSANLAILNWTGLSTGGGDDQVYFGNSSGGITTAQVNRLQFVNPTLNGITYAGTYGGAILSSGEIVAVIPEPAAMLLFVMGASGAALRRRRK